MDMIKRKGSSREDTRREECVGGHLSTGPATTIKSDGHPVAVAVSATKGAGERNKQGDGPDMTENHPSVINDYDDDDIRLAAVVPESPPSAAADEVSLTHHLVPPVDTTGTLPKGVVVDGVARKTNSLNTRFANSASTNSSTNSNSASNERIGGMLVHLKQVGDGDDTPDPPKLPFHPDSQTFRPDDTVPDATSVTVSRESCQTVIVSDNNHVHTHAAVSDGGATSTPPLSPTPNVQAPKRPIFTMTLPAPSTSSSSALNTPSDKCSPSSIGETSSSSSLRFDQRRRNSSVLLPMHRGSGASGGPSGGRTKQQHQSFRPFHQYVVGRRNGTSNATPEEEEDEEEHEGYLMGIGGDSHRNDRGGGEDAAAADDVGRYYEREYGVPNDNLIPQRQSKYVGDDPQLDALYSTISEHAAPQSARSNRGGSLMVGTSSTLGSGSRRGSSVATPHRMITSPKDSFNFGLHQHPSNKGSSADRRAQAFSGSGSPTAQLRGGISNSTVNVPSNFERAFSSVSPPLSAAGIPSPAASPSPSLSESSSPRILHTIVPPTTNELGRCPQAGLSDVVAKTHLMGFPQQIQPSADFDRSASGSTSPTTGGIARVHVGGGKSSRVFRGPDNAKNYHSGGGVAGSPNFAKTPSTRRIRRASSAVPSVTRVEEVYSHEHNNTYTVAIEPRRGGGGLEDGGSMVESVGGTTDPGSITRVYYNKAASHHNSNNNQAPPSSFRSRRNTNTTLHTVGGGSSGGAFSTNVHTTFDSSPNEHSVIAPDSYGAVVIDTLSEGDSGQSFGSEGWVRRELQRVARSEDRRVAFLKSPAPIRCLLFTIWAVFTRIGAMLRAVCCCCGSKFRKCCFVSYKEKFMPDEGVSAEELYHHRPHDSETMPQCCCIFALRCACCCGDVVYEPDIFEWQLGGDHHHHNRVANDDEGDLDTDDNNLSNNQQGWGDGGGGDTHWRTEIMEQDDDDDDLNNRGGRGRGGHLNGADRIHYTRHQQQQLRFRGTGTTPRQFRPFQHHRPNGVTPTQDGLGSFVDDEDDEELLKIDVLGRHFAPSDSFAAFRGGGSGQGSGGGSGHRSVRGGVEGEASLSPNLCVGGRESSEGFPLDDRSTPIEYDAVGSGDIKFFYIRSPAAGHISHNDHTSPHHHLQNNNAHRGIAGRKRGELSSSPMDAKPANFNSHSTSESDIGGGIGVPVATVHELVMPLNHREPELSAESPPPPPACVCLDDFGVTPLENRNHHEDNSVRTLHNNNGEGSTPIPVDRLSKVPHLTTSFTPTADSDMSDKQHQDNTHLCSSGGEEEGGSFVEVADPHMPPS